MTRAASPWANLRVPGSIRHGLAMTAVEYACSSHSSPLAQFGTRSLRKLEQQVPSAQLEEMAAGQLTATILGNSN